MYKVYRRFSIKNLGKDPMQGESTKEQINCEEPEDPEKKTTAVSEVMADVQHNNTDPDGQKSFQEQPQTV